jgi:hypothetical protein
MIDWLLIYSFTSSSRIFHIYGDVTIAGEGWKGLQNLSLCPALWAFEQGGIFIVPHLLWHGASVFPVSSEGPPHLVASYDTQGDVEDLFWPRSSLVWIKDSLYLRILKYTLTSIYELVRFWAIHYLCPNPISQIFIIYETVYDIKCKTTLSIHVCKLLFNTIDS